MLYVRTVKTTPGATAVQIVHSSRHGSRDIEHVGSAHDVAELELLKAAARRRLAAVQAELDLGLEATGPARQGAGGGPLPITSARMGVLLDALAHAYRVLGTVHKVDSDPGGLRERLDEATSRLTAEVCGLTDEQAREQSLLPGWSRGHVLTHLARNADGLRNLLTWARTGVKTPQYPGVEARDAGIEAGSGRPAAALAEDLRQSAAAFAAAAAVLPDSAWNATVHGVAGRGHPAWFTLFRRLTEVEIHHVDLRSSYVPADWPLQFVTDALELVAGHFASRDDVPHCEVEVTGQPGEPPQRFVLGSAQAGRGTVPVTVGGPGWLVLAWLTGRDDGTALSAGSGGHPPRVPAWG